MREIIQELENIHFECCFRENISSSVLLNTYIGSGDTFKAISAAVLTFGSAHAPITQCISLFRHSEDEIREYVKQNIPFSKIPGFGSSFVKGEPDPLFNNLFKMLPESVTAKTGAAFEEVQKHKDIYPNLALYTAAVGAMLGLDENTIPFLLLKCRTRGWQHTIQEYTKTGRIIFNEIEK